MLHRRRPSRRNLGAGTLGPFISAFSPQLYNLILTWPVGPGVARGLREAGIGIAIMAWGLSRVSYGAADGACRFGTHSRPPCGKPVHVANARLNGVAPRPEMRLPCDEIEKLLACGVNEETFPSRVQRRMVLEPRESSKGVASVATIVRAAAE